MGGFESVRLDNFGAYPVSNDTTHQTPENEYTRRLGDRQQQLADVRALHRRLWTYLIINALAGIAIACSTLSSHSISTLWILLPSVLVLFIFRSFTNNVCNYSRVQRIANFYELGIARLRHQWQGQGIGGEEFRPDKHPYATDLDLFGAGSLFELLCTARTGIGRATLANWLLNAAECREATERQEAIGELRARLGLQEDWASLGGQALAQVNSSAVRDWAGAPSVDFPLYVRVFAILLPICLITLSILAYVGLFGHYWLWAIAFPIGLEACLAA